MGPMREGLDDLMVCFCRIAANHTSIVIELLPLTYEHLFLSSKRLPGPLEVLQQTDLDELNG